MKWIDAGRCYKPKGTKPFLNSLEFCFSNHINKINDYPWFVHSKAHGLQRPLLVNRIISLFPLLSALFNPFVKLLSWDTTTANTVYATIHLVSVLFRICVLNYVCRWLSWWWVKWALAHMVNIIHLKSGEIVTLDGSVHEIQFNSF